MLTHSMWKPALVAFVVVAITPSARAQWLDYPTPGIPRTADGTPNLAAPTPRTPDGKPDLSGMWGWETAHPCPPRGCGDTQIGREFLNIAYRLKGGLPYQPWAAELVKQRKAHNAKDDPNAHCMPRGALRIHTDDYYKKFIQLPNLLVILTERNFAYRQIFLDSRPLPVDPEPTWNGYSVGRWEGDALVVKTIGFRDDLWLDSDGNPLTSAAKVTETFRRPNFGTLVIDITVDDPKAYSAPWTVTLTQPLMVDSELMDYYCLENEKDAIHLVGR